MRVRMGIGLILLLGLLVLPASAFQMGKVWTEPNTNTGLGSARYSFGLFNFTNSLYVTGGTTGAAYLNNTWNTSDGITWTQLDTSSEYPARACAASVVFLNKMWLIGGEDGGGVSNYYTDVWNSTNGSTWQLANSTAFDAGRACGAAVVYGNYIYYTGGYNPSAGWLNETWRSSNGIVWERINSTVPGTSLSDAGWPVRYKHSMVVLDGKMWVISGSDAGGTRTDAWYSTDGITWTKATDSAPGIIDGAITVHRGTAFATNTGETIYSSMNGADWQIVNSTTAIPARSYPKMATWNNTNTWDGLWLLGGNANANELWLSPELPVANATPLSTTGNAAYPVAWTDTHTGYATNYIWDFKDGYFSYERNASHVFTSAGTYYVSLTTENPAGSSQKTLTVSVGTAQSQVQYYTQKQVRIGIEDSYGVPLVGANITANYVASSLPSTDLSWLISAFGISSTVAGEMKNSSIAMIGYTGDDGGAVFMLFPSIRYHFNITNSSVGLFHQAEFYPQDSDYTIHCPLTSQAPPNSTVGNIANTSLWLTFPDSYHVTFNFGYQDTSGLTENVTYEVWKYHNVSTKDSGLPSKVYSIILYPGVGYVQDFNVTKDNIWGDEYLFKYNATRTAPF